MRLDQLIMQRSQSQHADTQKTIGSMYKKTIRII